MMISNAYGSLDLKLPIRRNKAEKINLVLKKVGSTLTPEKASNVRADHTRGGSRGGEGGDRPLDGL